MDKLRTAINQQGKMDLIRIIMLSLQCRTMVRTTTTMSTARASAGMFLFPEELIIKYLSKMYKEQFERVTSTSEINRYIISINEAMVSLLSNSDIDYKSLQDAELPLWLNKYIDVGIEKREDVNCYTYKNLRKFELFYQDRTGNEYSNNKVIVDKVGNVAKGLGISLKFAFKIAELLEGIPQDFNIVISYDNMDFVVSFYCKRKNEEWLIDDLDSYTDEAVFVITT